MDHNNHRPDNRNQIVLQSKIRTTLKGVEMLDFSISLGIVDLAISVAIPDEGTNSAPVYVHIKPCRPKRIGDRGARRVPDRGRDADTHADRGE